MFPWTVLQEAAPAKTGPATEGGLAVSGSSGAEFRKIRFLYLRPLSGQTSSFCTWRGSVCERWVGAPAILSDTLRVQGFPKWVICLCHGEGLDPA